MVQHLGSNMEATPCTVSFDLSCPAQNFFFFSTVNVKWGKEKYKDLECNTDEPPLVFKAQLFALTGVEPNRQKVMLKGTVLKDSDWTPFKLKDVSNFYRWCDKLCIMSLWSEQLFLIQYLKVGYFDTVFVCLMFFVNIEHRDYSIMCFHQQCLAVIFHNIFCIFWYIQE